MTDSAAPSSRRPAGLFRRFAAILYDSFLLAALIFVVGALWLPLTGGEAMTSEHPLHTLYQLSLLLVAAAFFCGFWMADGQTLGMRAWRLRLESADGGKVTLKQALLRFVAAILSWAALGLGFFWSLLDPQRRCWHDRLSSTVLLHEPKPR